MKLQSLTIIFIIIILPVVLVLSSYIGYEIKTINKQNMYNTGLQTATHDAIFAFEMNTRNDSYSNNAENKRSNIKASIKTFENSLSTACNLGLYNNETIEEYIPAIVFGLYDGFYMYAPSELTDEGENSTYKHNLRNYVYYSEEIKQGNIDIIIRYTLDNYVAVSGTVNGAYITRAGYLINLNDLNSSIKDININEVTTIKYKNIDIGIEKVEEYNGPYDEEGTNRKSSHEDKTAIAYYKSAYEFTDWFINETGIGNTKGYLNIGNDNDPENENSAFVQHKREIMKKKIEEVLNSSITAYANKTRTNYKMPKFSEEDWEKIYNNISVISFVQGMNLGFKNYNNYCVLNSTNNSEYVNPNLIYFTNGTSYHDIRCTDESIDWSNATGYKIGSFEKQTYEAQKKDEDGNLVSDTQGNPVTENKYYYKHNELACYNCINGNAINKGSIYDYVRDDSTDSNVKISYFTALARERCSTVKLLSSYNDLDATKYTITYKWKDLSGEEKTKTIMQKKETHITIEEQPNDLQQIAYGHIFKWHEIGTENYYYGGEEYIVLGNVTFEAKEIDTRFKIVYYGNNNNVIHEDKEMEGIDYTIKNFLSNISISEGEEIKGYIDNNNIEYNIGSSITLNENLELHPNIQTKMLTVQFLNEDNTNALPSLTVAYGEKILEPNNYIYDTNINRSFTSKSFIGWFKNDELYDFNQEVKNNIILVGKYDSFDNKIFANNIDFEDGIHGKWDCLYINNYYTKEKEVKIILDNSINNLGNVKKYVDNTEVHGEEIIIDNEDNEEKTVKIKFEIIYNNKYVNIKEYNIIFDYTAPSEVDVKILNGCVYMSSYDVNGLFLYKGNSQQLKNDSTSASLRTSKKFKSTNF